MPDAMANAARIPLNAPPKREDKWERVKRTQAERPAEHSDGMALARRRAAGRAQPVDNKDSEFAREYVI